MFRKQRRDRFLCVIVGGCLLACPLSAPAQRYTERANYSWIEDGLYLGGFVDRPPPRTRAVLNLASQRDPYRCEVHVWEPIRDGAPAPDVDWLEEQVRFISRQRRAGRTTFVHCSAGISRGALVVAAYLMERNHWSRDRALAYLRSRRPMIRPHPAFMELLREWERELRRTRRYR